MRAEAGKRHVSAYRIRSFLGRGEVEEQVSHLQPPQRQERETFLVRLAASVVTEELGQIDVRESI
jgi:hypothetical protein